MKKIRNFKTLDQIFDILFNYFEFQHNYDDLDEMDLDEESVEFIESELTLNYLTSHYRQLVSKRFQFLRNLLVLLKIIETSDENQVNLKFSVSHAT